MNLAVKTGTLGKTYWLATCSLADRGLRFSKTYGAATTLSTTANAGLVGFVRPALARVERDVFGGSINKRPLVDQA